MSSAGQLDVAEYAALRRRRGLNPLDLAPPAINRAHGFSFIELLITILEPIAAFREAIPVVAQHHEWYNGAGYPEGRAGEGIALSARIFAVADCYDAMISDRPYRKGLPKSKVIEMLKEKSGIQFDPKVIDVFVTLCAEEDHLSQKVDSGPVAQLT